MLQFVSKDELPFLKKDSTIPYLKHSFLSYEGKWSTSEIKLSTLHCVFHKFYENLDSEICFIMGFASQPVKKSMRE